MCNRSYRNHGILTVIDEIELCTTIISDGTLCRLDDTSVERPPRYRKLVPDIRESLVSILLEIIDTRLVDTKKIQLSIPVLDDRCRCLP